MLFDDVDDFASDIFLVQVFEIDYPNVTMTSIYVGLSQAHSDILQKPNVQICHDLPSAFEPRRDESYLEIKVPMLTTSCSGGHCGTHIVSIDLSNLYLREDADLITSLELLGSEIGDHSDGFLGISYCNLSGNMLTRIPKINADALDLRGNQIVDIDRAILELKSFFTRKYTILLSGNPLSDIARLIVVTHITTSTVQLEDLICSCYHDDTDVVDEAIVSTHNKFISENISGIRTVSSI